MVNNMIYVLCNSIDYIKRVCVTSHAPSLCISLFVFFLSLLILLSILLLEFLLFHYLLCFVMFGSFAENKGWSFDWHAQRWPNVILYMDHWFCPTKKLSLSQPQTALVQQIHTQIHMFPKKKKNTLKDTQNRPSASTCTQTQFHKAHQLQTAQSRFHFAVHLRAHAVRGFDIHTSLGQPAAEPPASAQWFVPKRPALWKKTAYFILILSSFFFFFKCIEQTAV